MKTSSITDFISDSGEMLIRVKLEPGNEKMAHNLYAWCFRENETPDLTGIKCEAIYRASMTIEEIESGIKDRLTAFLINEMTTVIDKQHYKEVLNQKESHV